MRVIFMGTPEFAVPSLEALVAAGHEVVAAYSRAPRPAHRGQALTPSPVHARAAELGVAVRTPASLREAGVQREFAALGAEAAVVAAYGLILPPEILAAPPMGCLNVHASLLPRWRGAAPVVRAILAGDAETGVTIMQMDAGLDTGAMLLTEATPVLGKTAGELTDELANLGAEALVRVLADPLACPPVPQGEGATYAAKVAKHEARLDFGGSADDAVRQVRAFNPAPGAWFELAGADGSVERVRVHEAKALTLDAFADPGLVLDNHLTIACHEGSFAPLSVQRAGRPRMPIDAFLRGFAVSPGTMVT